MSKKGIIGIVIFLVIVIVAVVAVVLYGNNNKTKTIETEKVATNEIRRNSQTEDENEVEKESTTSTDSKILVVYYSAQNHTEAVAKKIAENLGADTFEIVPKEVYTSDDLDWTDSSSRVSKEHNDTSLRNIELEITDVPNWEDYDTVLIGYPIWWGIAAWPTNTFVKANDFSGKTVIPFCTSSSSGLGQSGKLLSQDANGGTWAEGHRFNSSPSDSDIKSWTDSLR